MRSSAFWLTAWAALLPGIAAGQPLPPGTPPNLDRRVFVDVNAVAPGKVLDQLCDTIACTLDVDRKLPQPDISLRLSNVRARTALDAVCDIVGCRWSLKGRTLVVTATTPPPVPEGSKWVDRLQRPASGANWRFERVPLRDVLEQLSREFDCEVVWEGADLGAPVSVDLTGQHFTAALWAIESALGFKPSGVSLTLSSSGGVNKVIVGEWRQRASSPPVRVHDSHEPGLTLPKVVTEVKPSYTRETKQAAIQGVVVLSAVVEVDGTVGEVKVIRSLDSRLDAEAVAAAKQWTFSPGLKDGKPVPVAITLELTFTLRDTT